MNFEEAIEKLVEKKSSDTPEDYWMSRVLTRELRGASGSVRQVIGKLLRPEEFGYGFGNVAPSDLERLSQALAFISEVVKKYEVE